MTGMSCTATRLNLFAPQLRWAVLLSALLLSSLDRPTRIHAQPADHLNPPSDYIDDASGLNRTHVAEVWSIPPDAKSAEQQLGQLLAKAQSENRHVSVAGARHSMGGHTIYPDGIVIDMLPFNHLELNAEQKILHAGAGARWSQIIPYLDAQGLSVAVMQSFNDFSVGGSISVNAHGWQAARPPIASTVEAFRLMTADGQIVRCSRSQNPELFKLALGGYGLFGIILDVDLHVVPNQRYRCESEVLPASKWAARFAEKIKNSPDIGMIYGRLCIVPGDNSFLREAILTSFHAAPCKPDEIPALKPLNNSDRRREIYRAQVGNLAAKQFRWDAEKTAGEISAGVFYSRNQLLNEATTLFQEQNPDRVDILQEYFVPPDQLARFLDAMREIIPKYPADLLNVTLRDVEEDHDTILRYADKNMVALVLAFNQLRTEAADQQTELMTQELIAAALRCQGRYYLPYRLHATPEQFFQAYPQATEFFNRKRFFDPHELFQNEFYVKYSKR
ncbi:MAG TPA: FAD-binding oxidoreductase [Pirellulales bacterium]|jgi:FAD/FMN-containing dehydrogenase|nr:FAD-binding oxidoreductase [Pirellulales bacterium]